MSRLVITDTKTGEILDLRALSRPPRITRRRTSHVTRRKPSYDFTNTRSVIANSWGIVTLLCSGLALALALIK